jgi:peptide/nickel transport system permease protein
MLLRIGRRAVWIAALWLMAGFFGTLLVWMAPGFGIDERELDPRWTKESLASLRETGVDRGRPVAFYLNWMSHVVRGDLGESYSLGQPVAELLRERLPVTARSAAEGLAIGWALGLGLALSTFLARVPGLEAATATLAGALLCLPTAVIALVFLSFDGPAAWAIGAVVLPQVFSYTRNLCARAMQAPHVVMAVAKGLSRGRILAWHVLATAGPQLLALAGVSVTLAFTAALPIEVICDSPGIGQLAWLAAMGRDLPLLVNITLVVTAITLLANSLSDWATAVSGLQGAAR